jgi:protease I
MSHPIKKHIAVLATDGFEEAELVQPMQALRQAGAQVEVLAPHQGSIQGYNHDTKGDKVPVDRVIDEASPDDFDALLLPGGALNADAMRMVPQVQRFIKAMQDAHKPMAVICHAPWELVSAGLVQGRTLTSWPSLQDDIRNAGGTWVDREVVVDDNLVTSRKPADIPAFNREFMALLNR